MYQHSRIALKDFETSVRRWEPESDVNYRGLVVVVHGMASHGFRHRPLGEFLSGQGWAVTTYDQRGHGYGAFPDLDPDRPAPPSVVDRREFGWVPGPGGWWEMVRDLQEFIRVQIADHPQGPVVVLGHSMGTMVLRSALATMDPKLLASIAGVALSSPPVDGGISAWFGRALARVLLHFRSDSSPSRFFDQLVTSSFPKRKSATPPRTPFDRISSDPEEVDRYIADPLCGQVLSLGFYEALLDGTLHVGSSHYRKELAARLEQAHIHPPLFIMAGADDPIGGFGKSARTMGSTLVEAGFSKVETMVYPGQRHEILRDQDHDHVWHDLLGWMNGISTVENGV